MVEAASRLFGSGMTWIRVLGLATAAGLFLGLTGPFGSYLTGSLALGVAYWVLALWLGTICFGVIVWPAMRTARLRQWDRRLVLSGSVLLATLVFSVLCRGLAGSFWPEAIGRIPPLVWLSRIVIISAPITVAFVVAQRAGFLSAPQAHPTAVTADAGVDGSLLARVPPALGRTLVALQMEDHYVRVHMAAGSILLYLPMHQALCELGGLPGVRVHRSWWVARDAVVGSLRDGRNIRLVLSTGVHAPVARASVAMARAAGLLRGDDQPGRRGSGLPLAGSR